MHEDWVAIKGWEGFYEVSSFGRIRSVDRDICPNRDCKPSLWHYPSKLRKYYYRAGKPTVYLSRPGFRCNYVVCKLVAEAWVPNPNNYTEVIYIDNDIHNNHPSNLKWVPSRVSGPTNLRFTEDDEEWRPVPGYEDLYEVSNNGEIRSISRTVIRKRVTDHKVRDEATYQSRKLQPCRFDSTIQSYVYHLHRRICSGRAGQLDEYIRIETLMREVFPELYEDI